MPKELVGAAIFGLASLTDWLDGYLARRRKQVTTLGQLMDPLADKLLVTAAFVSLVQMDLAPAWMVAVILGREFAVTVLRSVAHARGVVISGVAAREVQDGLAGGRDPAADPRRHQHVPAFVFLGRIALWVAVVAAVASGVDYYRRFSDVLTVRVRTEPSVKPSVFFAIPFRIASARFCASARYSLFSNSLTRRS